MAPLVIPDGGLLLPASYSDPEARRNGVSPPQIMQLDLDHGMLYELIKSARHGVKNPQLSFGKTISLHYGTKTRALSSTPASAPLFLYNHHPEDSSKLGLAGRLSHKFAVQKAQEEVAGVDEALAKLQNSLASVEQERQSNQIKFLSDTSSLPAPVKRTAASLKTQSPKIGVLSTPRKDDQSSILSNPSTQHMPSSQGVGPSRPPVFSKAKPTTTPSLLQGRVQRIKALRVPLIHLLAIRPVSAKFLAREIRCKEDEVLEALAKIGKPARLDPSKFDLKDQYFKELDVWSWKYADQHDRDLVIQRATSAFDRIRLSPMDAIFQKLLPIKDRGKGKTLSKLDHLNKGPIQQSNTPRIHVQHSDDVGKHSSGTESDRRGRVAPSDSDAMAQQKSHDLGKKPRTSGRETQPKRLLSKGPKKVAPTAKGKEAHPAAKKGNKKTAAPLSSEFVNNSDEEDGFDDATAPHFQASPSIANGSSRASNPQPVERATPRRTEPQMVSRQNTSTSGMENVNKKISDASSSDHSDGTTQPNDYRNVSNKINKPVPNGNQPRTIGKASQKASEKNSGVRSTATGSTPNAAETIQGVGSNKKNLSRSRNISSPHKPSPLGSSPPTNATDIEDNGLSSASSTPLITMKNRETSVGNHPRNTSEHSLKRKTSDLDHDVHGQSNALPNVQVNAMPNGHINSHKRPKTSELTPPSSDSPSPPPLRNSRVLALEKAQKFKDEYYPKYQRLYREVEAQESPSVAQIERVEKMHERLRELKEEIVKEFAKFGG